MHVRLVVLVSLIAWKLAAADVNADGKTDVAATNIEADTVTVLLGR